MKQKTLDYGDQSFEADVGLELNCWQAERKETNMTGGRRWRETSEYGDIVGGGR